MRDLIAGSGAMASKGKELPAEDSINIGVKDTTLGGNMQDLLNALPTVDIGVLVSPSTHCTTSISNQQCARSQLSPSSHDVATPSPKHNSQTHCETPTTAAPNDSTLIDHPSELNSGTPSTGTQPQSPILTQPSICLAGEGRSITVEHGNSTASISQEHVSTHSNLEQLEPSVEHEPMGSDAPMIEFLATVTQPIEQSLLPDPMHVSPQV